MLMLELKTDKELISHVVTGKKYEMYSYLYQKQTAKHKPNTERNSRNLREFPRSLSLLVRSCINCCIILTAIRVKNILSLSLACYK